LISYLHQLQTRAEELNIQIANITGKYNVSPDSASTNHELTTSDIRGFHHPISDTSLGTALSQTTSHLGLGNSAELISYSLKCMASMLPDDHIQLPEFWDQPQAAFSSTLFDHTQIEFSSSVAPSTQRALIKHYIQIIQPEYPLLSPQIEATLLSSQMPIRLNSFASKDANALEMVAVLAISASLVARDIDPSVSNMATALCSVLHEVSHHDINSQLDSIESSRQTVKALCFLAICELVNSGSEQIWELCGSALVLAEQLRAELKASAGVLDDDYLRLEVSLLKLEK
jgi:hypothetical protein